VKQFLADIAALFLATGTAQQSAQAGYFGEDKWIANCRHMIIEKRRPEGDKAGEEAYDVPQGLMFIKPADLPNLEREIKEFKKCMVFWKCTEDRAAGKVKHCYENDSSLFNESKMKKLLLSGIAVLFLATVTAHSADDDVLVTTIKVLKTADGKLAADGGPPIMEYGLTSNCSAEAAKSQHLKNKPFEYRGMTVQITDITCVPFSQLDCAARGLLELTLPNRSARGERSC